MLYIKKKLKNLAFRQKPVQHDSCNTKLKGKLKWVYSSDFRRENEEVTNSPNAERNMEEPTMAYDEVLARRIEKLMKKKEASPRERCLGVLVR